MNPPPEGPTTVVRLLPAVGGDAGPLTWHAADEARCLDGAAGTRVVQEGAIVVQTTRHSSRASGR